MIRCWVGHAWEETHRAVVVEGAHYVVVERCRRCRRERTLEERAGEAPDEAGWLVSRKRDETR